MPRIALIHAVQVAIGPIERAFAHLWPEADVINLLDDSLPADRGHSADPSEPVARRIAALGDYAVAAGCHGILYSCSAFGAAIEGVQRCLKIPVLKPNEAMFESALNAGSRVGMLATFGPSVASMEAEFRMTAQAERRTAVIRSVLVAGAMDALKSGDEKAHNELVAEAALSLTDCDVVLLAHFSTSLARDAVAAKLSCPVLTSPESAVRKLRLSVAAQATFS